MNLKEEKPDKLAYHYLPPKLLSAVLTMSYLSTAYTRANTNVYTIFNLFETVSNNCQNIRNVELLLIHLILELQRECSNNPEVITASIIDVCKFGAVKYEKMNWKESSIWSLWFDAAVRHTVEYVKGDKIDEESNLPHLAHAVVNLGILYYMVDSDKGTNDFKVTLDKC